MNVIPENTVWVVLTVVSVIYAVIYVLVQFGIIRLPMNRLLSGITGEITVKLDRPDGLYEPGETVGVTVNLQPRKDMKLIGGYVKLSGMEGRYQSDGDPDYPTLVWVDNEFWSSKRRHLGQTTLPGGTFQHYDIQFSLPASARPSGTGEKGRVWWRISVKLGRPGLLPDLHAEKELQVTTRTPAG